MDELGFQPNFFAQALNNNRSHSLALLAQDITNPYYPALARGVQRAVLDSGHVVMLFDADAGPQALQTFIQDAVQRRVDGIIAAVSDIDDGIETLLRANIPVIVVGARASQLELDWVTADDVQIADDVVTRFFSLGHRSIGIISGPPDAAPGASRLLGYQSSMARHGINIRESSVVTGDWTREGGFSAMRRLLELDERPTAVFCANDLMAIGAVDAIRRAGLRIPEDIAVIGVDDIDAASLVSPSLTTVRIPAEEIGKAAGELLLHRLTNKISHDSPPRHILVQHRMIDRESA